MGVDVFTCGGAIVCMVTARDCDDAGMQSVCSLIESGISTRETRTGCSFPVRGYERPPLHVLGPLDALSVPPNNPAFLAA